MDNTGVEEYCQKLQIRVQKLEDLLEDFVLEGEHLPAYCEGPEYCICMDRSYYNLPYLRKMARDLLGPRGPKEHNG